MLSCRELLELREISQRIGIGFKEFLGVGILLREGYGRTAIAKKLGCRERLVRGAIEAIRRSGLETHVVRLLSYFHKSIVKAEWLTCTPVVYSNLDEELTRTVLECIVPLRDYIVVHSRNPAKVEVIGVVRGGRLEYPGLPAEIVGPYLKILEHLNTTSGLVVCWKSYTEYTDDSALLASLADLCCSSAP